MYSSTVAVAEDMRQLVQTFAWFTQHTFTSGTLIHTIHLVPSYDATLSHLATHSNYKLESSTPGLLRGLLSTKNSLWYDRRNKVEIGRRDLNNQLGEENETILPNDMSICN